MEIGRRLWRAREGDAGPDCSRRAAYIYLALFVPAIACIVLLNWQWNASGSDTVLLISSFEMLERFSSLFSNANANPLQALFDIFPSGLRLDMSPNMIGRALFGPGMHIDFFYIFCAALLACAVAAMARAAGMRWGVAVLAGTLLPLLVLPTLGMFPLVGHFYVMWPIGYYSAAGTVLVTALFWWIDGRSWGRSAVLTAVIILVLLHLSMIQILHMTLLAPALLAMGIGALAASRSQGELLAKIICAVIIVVSLASAGIFHYLYAIGINTASHVFYQELIDFMLFSAPSWHVILDDIGMVIINPFSYDFREHASIDGALAPLSQLGAVYVAVFGTTREARIFGRTVLVWVVATALVIAVLHNFYYYTGIIYQGPDPRHFIPILWPYYAICLASLIFALAEGGIALLSPAGPTARRIWKYVPDGLIILVLVGPATFLAANKILGAIPPNMTLGAAFRQTYLPPFRSHQPTPIVDYLEPEIGVAIDRDSRGSVVSMPTDYHKDIEPYKAWRREMTFGYARALLANDFGAFSLRYFNIPTLDQETHNITPQFYLTVRELLSRPGIDAYDKHFALVTRLNEPIMALLGLRYIIADYELPFGTQRLEWPIPEEARKILESERLLKSPVRVYELPHPNLGNYSPTNVVHATTAKATILVMVDPGFDGRHTVVTDDASIGDNLVPATGAAMTVRLGGVALRASSTGESVLVLPVQYSHCWQIVSGSEATLFRANLMQLGVRFSGELRLELRQFFGPFWQSSCRLADATDVERLRMTDALGAGAELGKTPGDGINVIPSPEALDTVIGNSAIVSIKALEVSNGPVREYKITAQGELGDHYSVLPVSNLTPGPYTLSMQVRANGAPRVALQINDGANGAFAEYLLPTRNAWVHRLGQADKLHASSQKIDDEWLQLTLTSTVSADKANVFVHVPDSRITAAFKPSGEAVTIRAVKLERGEIATPYPGFDQYGVYVGLPRRPKAPGDGINIIPNPEALDTVIGGGQFASFEPVATPNAPVRGYKLTATGNPTEHFIAISELPVRSGAHTLSMQARPTGAARMRLQMLDVANNGAIADYDLAAQAASMTNLVKSDKTDASIRKLDRDWLELSLTGTLESGISRVIIQLLGADGSNGFAPNGEAILLRGVKLERGETATPYLGLGQ
jgi:hypothetical protein